MCTLSNLIRIHKIHKTLTLQVKFNDYFEFPNEIDMQPYTDKGMEKMEKGELLEENKGIDWD